MSTLDMRPSGTESSFAGSTSSSMEKGLTMKFFFVPR